MTELFIDGDWAAGTGHVFASRNPGTDEIAWQGASASAADVDRAVASARRAFAGWSALAFDARCAIVKRFAELENLRANSMQPSNGRGYFLDDMEQLRTFGTSSAYAAVVIFAIYLLGALLVPETKGEFR